MQFRLDELDPRIGYKLLTATVTPRPIAWITSRSPEGVVNAAPYSFFNVMGDKPPIVAIGIMGDERGFKDSAANILATGEFVVNLVSEAVAPQMSVTSMDAPRGVDEMQCAGLTPLPSQRVKPPNIMEAPVSLECVNHATIVTGPHQSLVIGRVLEIRVDDRFVLDAEAAHIDTPALGLIGRMHGRGWYARTSDLFDMPRTSWAQWQNERG